MLDPNQPHLTITLPSVLSSVPENVVVAETVKIRINILVLNGSLLFLNFTILDIILRLLYPLHINTLYSSSSMCLHGAESFLRRQKILS